MQIFATAQPIDTIFGRFTRASKRRLDLAYDYEAAEIGALGDVAAIVEPELFLDIGANIGVYAIRMLGVPSIREVVAFEPSRDSFAELERNIALQDTDRVRAFREALSDRDGVAQFAVYGALAGNNALCETTVTRASKAQEVVEVPTTTLDARIPATGVRFLCKIDVEGHERSVLKGAGRFLRENLGVLQIEIFRHLDDVDALLAEAGYERIFRMKHDYYYTNIAEPALRDACRDAMFARVAAALVDLKDERRLRRAALRAGRDGLEKLKFKSDPVMLRPGS